MNFAETLRRYWWGFVIPVVIIVVAYVITEGKPPQIFLSQTSASVSAADGAISVSDILAKLNKMPLELDQENFLINYQNTKVYGSGTYSNIAKRGEDYAVAISVANGDIICQFSSTFQGKLVLLSPGQRISFEGVFSGEREVGGSLHVTDCDLLN